MANQLPTLDLFGQKDGDLKWIMKDTKGLKDIPMKLVHSLKDDGKFGSYLAYGLSQFLKQGVKSTYDGSIQTFKSPKTALNEALSSLFTASTRKLEFELLEKRKFFTSALIFGDSMTTESSRDIYAAETHQLHAMMDLKDWFKVLKSRVGKQEMGEGDELGSAKGEDSHIQKFKSAWKGFWILMLDSTFRDMLLPSDGLKRAYEAHVIGMAQDLTEGGFLVENLKYEFPIISNDVPGEQTLIFAALIMRFWISLRDEIHSPLIIGDCEKALRCLYGDDIPTPSLL
ncbi:hypothetical protein BC829DRAFT_414408 [Chytridium lagenaria]|nr:hypothetical protein BC829DRAFT_414408 [Chytridium lagenaria]